MTDAIVKLYVVRASWQFWGYLWLVLSDLVIEPLLMFGGIGLGAIEYAILRPAPLFQSFSWGMFLVAALTLTLSTGLPEELIFRGMLQRLALPTLGRWAIVY